MKARLLLLAPLLLFLGGCAVSAKGADVPQIENANATTTPAAVTAREPVTLARDLIGKAFAGSEQAKALKDIQVVDGALVVVMDRPAATLSAAELFMRYCRAVAPAMTEGLSTVPVSSVSVIQPDGTTIVAATAESAGCFYR